MNFKLYFKYIFFFKNQIFLKHIIRNDKNTLLLLNQEKNYYLSLHLKLSSLFYSTQLIDIFAYELPTNSNVSISKHNSILVYNFHSIETQQRFFFFLIDNLLIYKNKKKNSSNVSISELFLNANWLEREVAELHSFFFSYKKDLRNLLLPYGDSSAPMFKSFPSIGTREIFYDSVTDLLVQNPVSIQF